MTSSLKGVTPQPWEEAEGVTPVQGWFPAIPRWKPLICIFLLRVNSSLYEQQKMDPSLNV